jgi:putative transposase
MVEMIKYYINDKPPLRFSIYQKLLNSQNVNIAEQLSNKDMIVDIIAYCIMPTHIHLILSQLKDDGISIYMKNLLNSYTRYFNVKNKRKGPLWQGRFKSVLIETDDQLLHLTRYIHLNPTSSNLVKKPEEWPYSSYKEYIDNTEVILCNFQKYLKIIPENYKIFVETQKDYQRKLKEIEYLLFE